MKKILGFIALSVFTTSLFAFSWNGVFDNNTKVSTSEFESFMVTQSNDVYLSLNAPINENLRFSAEGLYKYNLYAMEGYSDWQNIADIDLFKLSGLWKLGNANFSLDVGRFITSDIASTAFSQVCDGLNLKYETAKMRFGFYAGYTGLLNGLNVSMTDGCTDTNDFYSLCAGYIPLSANFSYTSLLGSNVVGAQAYYFLGITDGLTNKLYGELSLNGPVSTTGSYSTSVVAGLNDDEFMLFAKADYSAYLGNVGIVGAGVDFATDNFATITVKSSTNSGLPIAGTLIPRVNAMYVSNSLIATLNEKLIFMTVDSIEYIGIDSSVTVLYNIFSDLQIGCDVAALVCKESFLNNFSVTAKATIAF